MHDMLSGTKPAHLTTIQLIKQTNEHLFTIIVIVSDYYSVNI